MCFCVFVALKFGFSVRQFKDREAGLCVCVFVLLCVCVFVLLEKSKEEVAAFCWESLLQ